jgi:hypothetical protein
VPVAADAMPGIANIAIPSATVGAARSADFFKVSSRTLRAVISLR